MNIVKINVFEVVLLIVGLTAAFLGFRLINHVYQQELVISWLMVIAIFTWLILLVIFVSLSVVVDVTKKQLAEIKNLSEILTKKKGK